MGKIVTLKDASRESWLEHRHNGIGGSDAPIIMGVNPWTTYEKLLWEKAQPQYPIRPTNRAMRRGQTLEPVAREMYIRRKFLNMKPLNFEHDQHEFLRASLDGYNENENVAIEIKLANEKDHYLAYQGVVPDKYMPQLQHILNVTGAKRIDYVSFNGRGMHIVEVFPNKGLIERLVDREKQFWGKVQEAKLKGLPEIEAPKVRKVRVLGSGF